MCILAPPRQSKKAFVQYIVLCLYCTFTPLEYCCISRWCWGFTPYDLLLLNFSNKVQVQYATSGFLLTSTNAVVCEGILSWHDSHTNINVIFTSISGYGQILCDVRINIWYDIFHLFPARCTSAVRTGYLEVFVGNTETARWLSKKWCLWCQWQGAWAFWTYCRGTDVFYC